MNHSVSTLTGKVKVKIVFLGNQSVGKSSVIQQYIHSKFQETSHPTVGIDFLAKNVIHKNKTFRLQLWDTAGQQRFRSLIPSYLKDAQCALILYDVTNKESFEDVQAWLKMYNENKTGGVTVLVGNKIDLSRERQISVQQGMKMAQSLGIFYLEISARTGQNIESLFIHVIEICTSPSIDPAKFDFQKVTAPPKIQEEQQKNEDDLKTQSKPNGRPCFTKQSNIDQSQSTPQNKQPETAVAQQVTPQPAQNQNENKVIRLQQKKQKVKGKNKSCC